MLDSADVMSALAVVMSALAVVMSALAVVMSASAAVMSDLAAFMSVFRVATSAIKVATLAEESDVLIKYLLHFRSDRHVHAYFSERRHRSSESAKKRHPQ